MPYAFSFPIRVAIGASIALGVSFIYVLLCGKEISFISGAIVSSATGIAMSVVMISRLLTRK